MCVFVCICVSVGHMNIIPFSWFYEYVRVISAILIKPFDNDDGSVSSRGHAHAFMIRTVPEWTRSYSGVVEFVFSCILFNF